MGYDLDKAPAEWVMRRSNRRELRVWSVGALFILIGGLMLVLAVGHDLSVAVSAVLLSAVVAAKPHAESYADQHFRLLRGAVAERDVGESLNALRREGWVVMHDIEQSGGGKIDHLVSGPNGVFVIETMTTPIPQLTPGKVMRQAPHLYDELDAFVSPVICLHTRVGKPFKTKGVWVVPRQHLLNRLRKQHNRPVEFERLARFADRL